jgi:hypothetical protein
MKPQRGLFRSAVAGAVLVSSVFVAGSVAWAQQKHPIAISGEGVNGRYVQQHIIEVDDAPGHQIRNFEIQRIFPADNQPAVDGELCSFRRFRTVGSG